MASRDDGGPRQSEPTGAGGSDQGGDDRPSEPTGERPAHLPQESIPDLAKPFVGHQAPQITRRSEPPPDLSARESLIAGLTQPRTTLTEVGEVAQRLSALPHVIGSARRAVRQVVLSFAIGLTLVLLGTMVVAGGTLRLVLGIFAGTGLATFAVFGTLRAMSYVGERYGRRNLPGPALLWVGGVVLAALGVTVAFTWSVSEVTKPLARTRQLAPARPGPSAIAAPSASATIERADAHLDRALRKNVDRGILFVPPAFESADGSFDLIIHYHGNREMVEQSVARAKLNALLLTINLGDGSGKYSKPLRNPRAFDTLLDRVEQRAGELGLRSPRLRRIALSSWSAGYGALYFILESRSRLDRIDSVILLDSMHGSFGYTKTPPVQPLSVAPFVRFARRAVAGEKLMVITHSAIETDGYPNTTQSADELLAELSLQRHPVDPDRANPSPVEIPVVLSAFPTGERRWLRVVNQAHAGELYVFGCTGKGKGDHIAHLAQMSETALPLLADRWGPTPRLLELETEARP